jgi:hypothetical protein
MSGRLDGEMSMGTDAQNDTLPRACRRHQRQQPEDDHRVSILRVSHMHPIDPLDHTARSWQMTQATHIVPLYPPAPAKSTLNRCVLARGCATKLWQGHNIAGCNSNSEGILGFFVISTKAEGRAEKSGRARTTRYIRGQMSRLRST